jgi:hypothetical protein
VITSHNVGVFVGTNQVRIIDHQTLSNILRSSRGDILYVLETLDRKEFEKTCGNCYKILRKESNFGELQVSIPMVGLTKLLVL